MERRVVIGLVLVVRSKGGNWVRGIRCLSGFMRGNRGECEARGIVTVRRDSAIPYEDNFLGDRRGDFWERRNFYPFVLDVLNVRRCW